MKVAHFSFPLFKRAGVNGIAVMVMYGGIAQGDRWGNVITDVWGFPGEKNGHKGEFKEQDSAICQVGQHSEKIKSRDFYIFCFLLKLCFSVTE